MAQTRFNHPRLATEIESRMRHELNAARIPVDDLTVQLCQRMDMPGARDRLELWVCHLLASERDKLFDAEPPIRLIVDRARRALGLNQPNPSAVRLDRKLMRRRGEREQLRKARPK